MSKKPSSHPLTVPVVGIFLLMLVHGLIIASAFLIPVTSAFLAYFLLNAPRRGLNKLGISAPLAAAFFTLLIGAALILSAIAFLVPITDFIGEIPVLISKVQAMATSAGGPFEALNRAAEATSDAVANAMGSGGNPTKVEVVDGPDMATSVVTIAPGLLGQLIFTICLLFFLVASGDLFIEKAVQVMDRFHDKKKTVITIHRIERRLGNYLGSITLINSGLGICIGVAMWFWELPSPWLIGMMGAVLNFVPFVGAIVGSVIAGMIALVTFMDPWSAIGVLLTYYGLTAFEGQFVTPTLLGRRLQLNVVVVFLSVAFFAWIWSVIGMVIAVPMLVVLKVICDSIPRFQKIGLFLGDAQGFTSEETEEERSKR